MKKSRLLCKFMCPLLAAAMLSGTAMAFTDTSGSGAESAIHKWSSQYGIIQGYKDGTFRPNRSITRGAFAAILVRFLQYSSQAPAATFSDIQGAWCESEVLKLAAVDVYQGDNGQAKILSNITRQQAVAMIARAFGISATSTAPSCTDAGAVASYARGYVSAMIEKGYVTDLGTSHRFRPTDDITRAEVVNILNNMVDVLLQQSCTYTQNVTGTLMLNASGVTLKNLSISGDLIIAPGVTGTVTLQNVKIGGSIRNLGSAKVSRVTSSDTPPTTGQYITYGSYKIPVLADLAKSILTKSNFFWNNGRLNCTSNAFTTRFGIDVSSYQNRNTTGRKIDWNAVSADGVKFAIIRVGGRGYGASGNLFSDTYYAQNLDGCMAAGIDTGAYFFSQATTVEEAEEEADYALRLLNGRQISGPVAYDWEVAKGYRICNVDKATATACALAFCRRIAAAGYQPAIYAGKNVGYLRLDLSQLKDYPLWYPEYKYSTSTCVCPSFYYQVDCWQYNNKTKINGIGGNVDANLQFIKK